jgi:zinc protease
MRRPILALTLLGLPAAGHAQQAPTQPPDPAPLITPSYPAPQEVLLPNGLRLVVLHLPRQPLISLTLSLPAGSAYDPTDLEGTADIMAGLLTRGAGDRSVARSAPALNPTP